MGQTCNGCQCQHHSVESISEINVKKKPKKKVEKQEKSEKTEKSDHQQEQKQVEKTDHSIKKQKKISQGEAAIKIQRNWKKHKKQKEKKQVKAGANMKQQYTKKQEGFHLYFKEEMANAQPPPDPNRVKNPPYQFQSGAVYEGEWKDKKRDGFGIQKWPDGAKYEGQWVDNKACGKGKFYHADGDVFEGEWKDDKANGWGIYKHQNGAMQCEWRDDLQHGKGTETWQDKSKYSGDYIDGKKHGKGRYDWADGSYYDGEWKDNKINGFGTYKWADGRGYTGEWLDNNMNGKGVYQWQDGRKYEGSYLNDKKHGFGIYYWADGRRYEGGWKNGIVAHKIIQISIVLTINNMEMLNITQMMEPLRKEFGKMEKESNGQMMLEYILHSAFYFIIKINQLFPINIFLIKLLFYNKLLSFVNQQIQQNYKHHHLFQCQLLELEKEFNQIQASANQSTINFSQYFRLNKQISSRQI